MRIQLGSFSIPDRENYIPYTAGLLESVAKKDLAIRAKYEEFIFEDPLWDYDQLPVDGLDILGLTCYVWSQDHCDALAEQYKEKNPNCIIIFGGPNIPTAEHKWQEYEDARPYVDCFVAGTGEEIFIEILRSFPNIKKWYKLDKDNKYKHQTPMVYLDGTLDKFFNTDVKFNAVMETNRGCPFKCSFCDWGDATGSVVSKFDQDVSYEVIDKLLKADNIKGIRIMDANWGMYERDLEMTKYMAQIKRPEQHITFCGVAKNSVKYTPQIAKIFYDNNFMGSTDNLAQPMKVGVQSWHPTTLKYNARDNIKESAFVHLLDFYKQNNIPYVSELIMGLPGETPESWLYTLDKDVEFGVAFQNIYPLEMVTNMPMLLETYDMEFQDVWIHKELSKIGDSVAYYHRKPEYKHDVSSDNKKDYVVRKLMKSCFSYTNDDLRKIYDYTWWMNTFYNTGMLGDITKPSENILHFYETLESKPLFKKLVDRHRACFDEAYTDGKLSSLHSVRYWMKTLNKCNEIIEIYNNLEQAQDELNMKIKVAKPTLSMYNYGWRL